MKIKKNTLKILIENYLQSSILSEGIETDSRKVKIEKIIALADLIDDEIWPAAKTAFEKYLDAGFKTKMKKAETEEAGFIYKLNKKFPNAKYTAEKHIDNIRNQYEKDHNHNNSDPEKREIYYITSVDFSDEDPEARFAYPDRNYTSKASYGNSKPRKNVTQPPKSTRYSSMKKAKSGKAFFTIDIQDGEVDFQRSSIDFYIKISPENMIMFIERERPDFDIRKPEDQNNNNIKNMIMSTLEHELGHIITGYNFDVSANVEEKMPYKDSIDDKFDRFEYGPYRGQAEEFAVRLSKLNMFANFNDFIFGDKKGPQQVAKYANSYYNLFESIKSGRKSAFDDDVDYNTYPLVYPKDYIKITTEILPYINKVNNPNDPIDTITSLIQIGNLRTKIIDQEYDNYLINNVLLGKYEILEILDVIKYEPIRKEGTDYIDLEKARDFANKIMYLAKQDLDKKSSIPT